MLIVGLKLVMTSCQTIKTHCNKKCAMNDPENIKKI